MTPQYNRTFGTLYHATTKEGAERIRKEGFKIGTGGAGGPGIYLTQSEKEAKNYGEEVIPVTLTKGTLIHPNPYDDSSVAHLVGPNTSQEDWSHIPEILAKSGWHGHVDDQGGGENDHVVVYQPSRIRFL